MKPTLNSFQMQKRGYIFLVLLSSCFSSAVSQSFICFLPFTVTIQGEAITKKELSQDTLLINSWNKKAYENRRKYPDTAFILARKALKLASAIGYQNGIGNAYIAIGYTHLVNYTKNDSAFYYIHMAYDTFKELGDKKGMATACFGLGYVFSFRGNLNESEKYIQQSLQLYKESGNKKGMYNSYNSLCYIYNQKKDYQKAYDYIQEAFNVAVEIRDTVLMADAQNSLGHIYKNQGLFQQAMDVYFNALKLWEIKKDSAGMSLANGNIGILYYYQKDFDKALEYYHKKLPLSIKSKNSWEISKTYNNIALVYNSLSGYDSSLIYYKKGLQLNMMMNYPPGVAESYYNLSNTYLQLHYTDSAYYYIRKCISIAENINATANLADYYILLGKIDMAIKDYKTALKNVKKGYEIGKALNIPFVISDATKLLSSVYSKQHKYDKAYSFLQEHMQMQDSLIKVENIKKITRLEMQYSFDKKLHKMEYEKEQQQLAHKAELKQQKLYLLGAVIFTFFILLSAILIIRQKNLQVKIKTIGLEQKLLRVQMNPHFIFNSLCAIQDFIINNHSEEANRYLTKFAKLMRSILENARKDYIPLENEIKILEDYLEIQKLRFETNFDYSIEIAENIDAEIFAIPPMLAQPFIENSIEHGLLPKKGKGKISIRFNLVSDLIRFEVEDNGVGRNGITQKTSAKTHYEKRSLSIALTRERIKYLRKAAGKNVRFEIIDIGNTNEPTGTKVVFQVPFQKIIV
jgi:tetratricopeptide (TPR) repeat protein